MTYSTTIGANNGGISRIIDEGKLLDDNELADWIAVSEEMKASSSIFLGEQRCLSKPWPSTETALTPSATTSDPSVLSLVPTPLMKYHTKKTAIKVEIPEQFKSKRRLTFRRLKCSLALSGWRTILKIKKEKFGKASVKR